MILKSLEQLLEEKTLYRVGKELGISPQWMWSQQNRVGFSMNTLKLMKRHYPELDLNDLIMNYPRTKEE